MKKSILTVALLFFCSNSWAAFTKAQTGVGNSATGGTTVSVALASNPAAGSLVCVGILFYDGGTTPPTWTTQDGNSNTYNNAASSGATNMDTAGWIGQSYLANAPSNAEKTITVTFNKSNVVAAIWVDNFTPSTGVPAFDNSASANGSGTINTPSIPVAGSNELVYSTVCDANDSGTTSGAWTINEGGKFFANGSAWILDVSANTSVGWTGTIGNAYNAIGMSFSMSASGAVIKTVDGLALASVKTINGLAIGSVKTRNGTAAQ